MIDASKGIRGCGYSLRERFVRTLLLEALDRVFTVRGHEAAVGAHSRHLRRTAETGHRGRRVLRSPAHGDQQRPDTAHQRKGNDTRASENRSLGHGAPCSAWRCAGIVSPWTLGGRWSEKSGLCPGAAWQPSRFTRRRSGYGSRSRTRCRRAPRSVSEAAVRLAYGGESMWCALWAAVHGPMVPRQGQRKCDPSSAAAAKMLREGGRR